MATTLTLDDFIGRFQLSKSRIVELGASAIDNVRRYAAANFGIGRNEHGNHEGQNTRVLRTSWGHEIGYLVNLSWLPIGELFPNGEYTDEQIALRLARMDYSDRRTKSIHVGQSRTHGGVYEEHPMDMVRLYFEIMKKAGARPKYNTAFAIDEHDNLEKAQPIDKLQTDFKNERKRAREADKDSVAETVLTETPEMRKLRNQIKTTRRRLVTDWYSDSNSFVANFAKAYGISDADQGVVIVDGAIALGLMDWMTRHTEQKYFHTSMYPYHIWQKLSEYLSSKRGGPFQANLMELLGVPLDGVEPPEYYLERVLIRSIDRIALSRERKPRFNARQTRELEEEFRRHGWLRELYGELKKKPDDREGIDFRGKPEQRPYQLNALYRNFIVLQNVHFALQRYGGDMVRLRQENPTAYSTFLAVIIARDYLLEETKNIIDGLGESYERDLARVGNGIVASAKRSVGERSEREKSEITGEGPISRGVKYDTWYKHKLPHLDVDQLDRIENYKDVLAFGELWTRFTDTARNVIDVDRGLFRMFTIKGLTDKLQVTIDARPYLVG